MTVLVDFECEVFTIVRDTKYHKKPEEFPDCDHKVYSYAPHRAAHQPWFKRAEGEGFEFLPAELKKEPEFEEGDKETATGNDLYEHIMEVVER